MYSITAAFFENTSDSLVHIGDYTMKAENITEVAYELIEKAGANIDWHIAYVFATGNSRAVCFELYNLIGVYELYEHGDDTCIFSYVKD